VGGTQTPWAARRLCLCGDGDELVLCFTRKEGRVRWVHQLPQFQKSRCEIPPDQLVGPVLVSNKLILLSSDGFAEAISPYNGQLLAGWRFRRQPASRAVVANDTLYIYTNDAQLVALR